jgi:hypothetical protein
MAAVLAVLLTFMLLVAAMVLGTVLPRLGAAPRCGDDLL